MNVYLVPSGPNRHELYCEIARPATDGERAPATSLWRRMADVFHRVLAEGERAREAPGEAPRGLRANPPVHCAQVGGSRGRAATPLASSARDTGAAAVTDDRSSAAAMLEARRLLAADRDKHLRWMLIDGLLILLSAPVALLPGPNVLAYYFIFRSVGHFLSMRGAQQGLSGITWDPQPSAPLSDLRSTLALDRDARRLRVDAIASALGLDRLTSFVDEMVGG